MKISRVQLWSNLLLLLIVGASGFIFYLLQREKPTEVISISASYRDLSKTISTTGKVTPLNEFQARANFPGIIEKIYVSLGDKVVPGQMLVTMRDPFASSRVASANAAVEAAEAANENVEQGGSQEERISLEGDRKQAQLKQDQAETTLSALRRLHLSGAASAAEVNAAEKQLDAATATLKTLEARRKGRFSAGDLKSTRARLSDAHASLDAAKIQFDNANITSPISGIVYSLPVLPYDFVPMGAELLHVANLKQVQIRAFFDEPEIGSLKVGQAVEINWDARPNETWHGRIKQAPVAAMVMGPRSVGECTITAEDAKGELLPNITVTVKVTTESKTHVLTIPRAALHTEGTDHFVYRVSANRLVRTEVQVGIVNLSYAEITKGIATSDLIALRAENDHSLSDGMEVSTDSPSSGRANDQPDPYLWSRFKDKIANFGR